jgi:hypothetical protein
MRIIKFYLKTTWKFTALFLCLTFCSCQLEKKNNESKALEVFYSANKQSEDVKKFEFIFEQISDLQKDNSIVGAEELITVAQDKIDVFLKKHFP